MPKSKRQGRYVQLSNLGRSGCESTKLFIPMSRHGRTKTRLTKITNKSIQTTTTRELKQVLEDIFIKQRIKAFERYNFICRKQRKNETLEQFYADLVELASRADCGDKEDEWVRDMFTAHMDNEKIAEELLAETRTP